ncbi:MAG: L,D-transpeptidase family protein [Pseudomonadota bacterium]
MIFKYKIFCNKNIIIGLLCVPLLVISSTSNAKSKSSIPQATKILVQKKERQLCLLQGKKVLKTYKIALGFNPVGHKRQQGDGRTPEGTYKVDYKNPKSTSHLSLHLSYPNAQDKKQARKNKVSPGGDICIHGLYPTLQHLGAEHIRYNWTHGCIAVTNKEIEEIWKYVRTGITVEIRA